MFLEIDGCHRCSESSKAMSYATQITTQQLADEVRNRYCGFCDSALDECSLLFRDRRMPDLEMLIRTRNWSDRANPLIVTVRIKLGNVESYRMQQSSSYTIAGITNGIQFVVYPSCIAVEFGGYAERFETLKQLGGFDNYAIGKVLEIQEVMSDGIMDQAETRVNEI